METAKNYIIVYVQTVAEICPNNVTIGTKRVHHRAILICDR